MLEQLKNLGFVDYENGYLNREDEIILLHIYKSKLSGENLDIDEVVNEIEDDAVSPSLAGMDAQLFEDGFVSGIERVHSSIGRKKASLGDEESFKAAKRYEILADKVFRLKLILNSKRENLEVLKSWMEDENSFRNVMLSGRKMMLASDFDSKKEVLARSYAERRDEYLRSKIKAMTLATEYILSSEVREGKYSLNQAL